MNKAALMAFFFLISSCIIMFGFVFPSNNIVQFSIEKNINCDSSSSIDWDALLSSATLTANQLLQYFLWTNHSSCQLSHYFGGIMMKNPSGLAGQKVVCIDPKVAPKPRKCLVYSFGINNEWSFDEKMSLYGCEVFSFDPSMGLDHHVHSPGNIHFYNWGLGDRNEYDQELNWTIRSLSSIYETLSIRHGRKVIDYLKIDIEYSEWIALPDIISSGMLSKVRQLGIEVHLEVTDSLEQHLERARVLRSIEKSGMIRFDSEYNPWYFGNFTKFHLTGSLGYEIAWYNGKLFHDA
ncbi:probable methyltransferase-like protein 24 [Daphnia pulicaria]|uniref:probable methyltransferase-like protein 24 n=1 Tax=Daphnia pulicaria TaxID=35523 RepID=UPI001EEABD8A|nr:probable methyltransferase-like protein 24 [Daphnia pulicaria]